MGYWGTFAIFMVVLIVSVGLGLLVAYLAEQKRHGSAVEIEMIEI